MSLRAALGVGLLALAATLPSCKKDAGPAAVECGPPTDQAPDDLACTGLYSDFESKTVSKTARLYAPAVSFWSDGYEKSRWIEIPAGQTIDATDMDDWKFPVGTKVWKEFASKGRKIETRLLWKSKADGWVVTTYVWTADGSSATRTNDGDDLTVDGLKYHVPAFKECNDCHKGRKDTLLGFEAISLAQSTATGVTLATLAQENLITPAPTKTAVTMDAGLGTLHVNCGVSCHNATSAATRHDSNIRLRVTFDEAANKPVTAWELYGAVVNVPAKLPAWTGGVLISPGAPAESVIIKAMGARGTDQMPPNTRDVDTNGIAAVTAFVSSLPAP